MQSLSGAEPGPNAPLLDWVRGIAALLVFATHLRDASFVAFGFLPADEQTVFNAVWFALSRLGHEAVLIFFVLSGFLVGGRELARFRAGDFDVGRYAAARVARIGIVCIPAVLLAWAVTAYAGTRLSAPTILGNMVGLQSVAVPIIEADIPLWSLAYEIWFYVLCGAALCVASPALRWSAVPIALGSLLVLTFVLDPSYLVFWLGGAAAFLWRPARTHLWLLALAILLLMAGTGLHQIGRGTYNATMQAVQASQGLPVSTVDGLGQWLFAAGAALLMPLLRSMDVLHDRKLAKLGAALAAVSYSLYLSHYPVLWFMNTFMPQAPEISLWTVAEMLLRGVACIAVALAFYSLFERHTQRVRDYLLRMCSRKLAAD